MIRPEPVDRILGRLCVSVALVAHRLELSDSVLQHRVGEIGNAVLDGIVEPLEFGVRFGRTLAQFGDMRRSALSALLATVQDGRGHFERVRAGRRKRVP